MSSVPDSSAECSFLTLDHDVANREARRRSSRHRSEYFIGVRAPANDAGSEEYIVAPIDQFRSLHEAGGWLLQETYGTPVAPEDLVAVTGLPTFEEAMLNALMRVGLGAPPLFIAARDGEYLVAPVARWPAFATVYWTRIDTISA